MRTNLTRAVFAVGTLIWMALPAPAEDLRFSAMDPGMRSPSQFGLAVPGVRQMAYQPGMDGGGEMLPSAPMPMGESVYEPMYASDQGGCAGGTCGGCGCGDGCCSQGAGCCPQYDCWGSQGDCCYGTCDAGCCTPDRGMFYGEVQLMLLRAHVAESALGKLSESHEFSPRLIFGYETCTGIGARTRYWMFDEEIHVFNSSTGNLDLDWSVVDIEGTARFRTDRADLLLAAGFRWADATIAEDGDELTSDMPGITLAADGRAWICQSCVSQWSAVCGARWSILGGDWEDDDETIGDDNVTIQELYAGFEYLRYLNHYTAFARLVFEAQNWKSDVLSDEFDIESITFLGPGFHVGATY